jgi:uncharacterized membrane protein
MTEDAVTELSEAAPARPRLDGLDMLRGLVMVLMALDHARDYFSPTVGPQGSFVPPERLGDPGLALFATRWVTHFCAPVFVFLAGVGAYLYGSRGRSRAQVARFLFTRGLFLVVLEFTVVQFGWTFTLLPGFLIAQVIWAIGVSMMLLSALVWLPTGVVAAFGLLLVLGHNLMDGWAIQSAVTDGAIGSRLLSEKLWAVLHVQGFFLVTPSLGWACMYPLVPWVGLMALGFVFGPVFTTPGPVRRRLCTGVGAALCLAFVALRLAGGYGDPGPPFEPQGDGVRSLIAFLNTEKYPPSLQYLLMTLGPTLLLMPLFERLGSGFGRPLVTIGRVPLLYYVVHIYLIHALAMVWAFVERGGDAWGLSLLLAPPSDYGGPLWHAYLAWALVVVGLYPLCRWFAAMKQRSRSPWLSYL